jgi:2-haloacid dehalogenase
MAARIYVFDAYGTLFDVHAAIGHYRDLAGVDAERMSEIWRAKQLEYTWTLTLSGQYTDFWTLTERALDYALARTSVDKELKPKLLEAYFQLSAFPDAKPMLRILKQRGDKIAILSNGSPKMLAGAVDAAGISAELDAVLSVDMPRVFKPRPEVYRLVTDRFSCRPVDVIFVSSNRWDVMGAKKFGFRCVWVNRSKLPDEYAELPPDKIVSDLTALPEMALD